MTDPRTRRLLASTAATLGTVLLLVGVVHAYASWQYARSFAAAPLTARLSSAERALNVEPWNRTFERRHALLLGLDLDRRGEIVRAYDVLHAALDEDPTDETLRREFKRVEARLFTETVRKAHLQHGHEGPNGELDPEDIER